MSAPGLLPIDSPNASTPQLRAKSAASAFISEIAVIALPARSAAWKVKNPPNVPSSASAAHPETCTALPWAAQLTVTALIPASATP